MPNVSTTSIQSLYNQIDALLPTGSLPPPYITTQQHSVLQKNIVDRISARIVDAGPLNIYTTLYKHTTGTIKLRDNLSIPNSDYMVSLGIYFTDSVIWSITNKTPTSFSWQAYQYRGTPNQIIGCTIRYIVFNTSEAIGDTINTNKQ